MSAPDMAVVGPLGIPPLTKPRADIKRADDPKPDRSIDPATGRDTSSEDSQPNFQTVLEDKRADPDKRATEETPSGDAVPQAGALPLLGMAPPVVPPLLDAGMVGDPRTAGTVATTTAFVGAALVGKPDVPADMTGPMPPAPAPQPEVAAPDVEADPAFVLSRPEPKPLDKADADPLPDTPEAPRSPAPIAVTVDPLSTPAAAAVTVPAPAAQAQASATTETAVPAVGQVASTPAPSAALAAAPVSETGEAETPSDTEGAAEQGPARPGPETSGAAPARPVDPRSSTTPIPPVPGPAAVAVPTPEAGGEPEAVRLKPVGPRTTAAGPEAKAPTAADTAAPPVFTTQDGSAASPGAPREALAMTPVDAPDWRLGTQGVASQATAVPASVRPEHVAGQITLGIGGASADRPVELRLDPPELGRVHIHLTPTEHGLQAMVMAERPETHEFLRRHAEVLTQDLNASGYDNVTLEFATGGQSGPGNGERPPEGQSFALGGAQFTAEAQAPATRAREKGSSALDIRL